MPFNKNIQELIDFLKDLPPHEKLQEISKVMLLRGRYRVLKEALSDMNFCFILDSVNYNSLIFDDPLPMKEILDILNVEPGYGSLTGNVEVGDVIREFEISRAYAFANQYHLLVENIRHVIEDTMVLTTFGATGGIYTALMALLARERATGRNRAGIVFNAPTYCLSDAFARLNGLTPIPVVGTRENGFFPPLALIHEACIHSSVFACVLTYPNNPAQHSFKENEIPELLRLIAYCQSNQIQLIADTVFQELRWLSAPPVPELFALADSSDCLCKIFSPSKDRPLASGYRIGYLMTDEALVPWLEQVASCTTSSPNTLSQIWLAIDTVFRRAMIEGELTQAFFLPLKNSPVFGFRVKQEIEDIYHKICDANLYDNYVQRVEQFMETLDKGLDKVWNWLRTSDFFEVDERPPYGNTLMVHVPKQAQFQNEFEYYFKVLLTTGVIASMGGCFGVPSDEGIYFRVVVASYPPELVIAILGYVKETLLSNKLSE
jgi:aspartate/methionine/tyrosine aminotransferase